MEKLSHNGLRKKIENTRSLMMNGHYFKHYVLLIVLMCEAKSMIAKETGKLGPCTLAS